MKKTLVSAVLLAALALTACNADKPAETSAPAETTTAQAVETEATEESKDTEATEATDATEATEDSVNRAGYDKYKAVTDSVKEMVDTKEPTSFQEISDPTGLLEVINVAEDASSILKYALADIDKDGTDELFIIKDMEHQVAEGSYHEINILNVFTLDADGKPVPVTSGWERNRLQYLKDGSFFRSGSAGAEQIVLEFQKYDPEKKVVYSVECYYTNGQKDADGTLIMFKAKDPAAPAFDGSDEEVGPYEEFQIADDIYVFEDAVSFSDFY